MSLTNTAVYLQDRCTRHQYIRSRDTSGIVERPERLRAVHIGLAAAIARINQLMPSHLLDLYPEASLDKGGNSSDVFASSKASKPLNLDDLAGSMADLSINITPPNRGLDLPFLPPVINVVHSDASVNILNNAAVKYIHGDIDGDVYLESLSSWVASSATKIAEGGSEIPERYSQGDLYLCPESLEAIQGALGTVCEAVDNVLSPTESRRAFVAIRPPGHHCGEDTPSGFCFVNNVAVAAAHAHLKHDIKRAVIFDIDLHHGNGTQSIAWQINEEAYRKNLESEYNQTNDGQSSLRIFYGSVHDVLSFPCEDGDAALVQAASTSLHGPLGQYIENVHLRPYTSEEHFWDSLYNQQYSKLFDKARSFLQGTGGSHDDVIIFISCGFDACEHEYESMSRHGRKVPASFYYRFTRDARQFADKHAGGRLISVLEGGYSDRALISGAMAHLAGLVDLECVQSGLTGCIDEAWWGVDNLTKLEKATKKRKGGRPSVGGSSTGTEEWLINTLGIFAQFDGSGLASQLATKETAASLGMRLRDRSASKPTSKAGSPASSPKAQKVAKGRKGKPQEHESDIRPVANLNYARTAPATTSDVTDPTHETSEPASKKPLKVTLKLGQPAHQ